MIVQVSKRRYALLSKKHPNRVLAVGTKRQVQKRERQIRFFQNLRKRIRDGKRPFVPIRSQTLKQALARWRRSVTVTRRGRKRTR